MSAMRISGRVNRRSVKGAVAVGAVCLLASACGQSSTPLSSRDKDIRSTNTAVGFKNCGGSCTGEIDGAKYAIRLPAKWNGTLLLYSHGYRFAQPAPPNFAAVETDAQVSSTDADGSGSDALSKDLLAKGYALAGSSYKSNGWAVADGVKAGEDLRAKFVSLVGKPKRTYVWGDSLGGLITELLSEKHPEWVDGAAPMCGALAGPDYNFDLALDVAYATKVLIYPDLKLTGYASADEAGANWKAAAAAVQKAAADVKGGGTAKVLMIAQSRNCCHDLGETRGERNGSKTDDVRGPVVGDDLGVDQGSTDPCGVGVSQGDMATSSVVLLGGNATNSELGQFSDRQFAQEAGQGERPDANLLNSRLRDHVQGSHQGGHAQDRRRADLHPPRSRRWVKIGTHIELPILAHPEPTGQARLVLEVAPGHEQPADRSWATVEIFVRAPEGEVGPPIVKAVWHRADRVRAIPPEEDSSLPSPAREALHVEQLPTPVDHRRQNRHRNLVGHRIEDGPLIERPPVLARDQFETIRGHPPQPQMAGDGVTVRREVEHLSEDLGFRSHRLVKSRQKLMEVAGGRPSHDDLIGLGPDQGRHATAQGFGQGEPGGLRFQPAPDPTRFPIVQRSNQTGFRPLAQ